MLCVTMYHQAIPLLSRYILLGFRTPLTISTHHEIDGLKYTRLEITNTQKKEH